MLSRNVTPFHTTIMTAREEACAGGSRKIEAEHLLLALSRQDGTDAKDILESAGLDHEAILQAIESESEQSLKAVGVTLGDKGLLKASGARDYNPRFGQSAKLALARAADLEAKRIAPPLEPIHLLVGILHAKAGTVPRIIAVSGVDADALTSKAEEALTQRRECA